MDEIVNLSDVFISYSRRNSEFAHKLDDAFKAQNMSVWADWEDIPKGANWRNEIRAGVEGASAFLFIISPDSVMSEECRKEVELAVHSRKRFVPVLHVDLEKEHYDQMHPAIGSHNWIFARESDDWDTAFEEILQTAKTDLEYVHTHTRINVHANEWERHERDGSLLLIGTELTEAEEWLADSVDKEPPATALQHDFILISRQSYTARQRKILAGVTIALIVSIVLGILSFLLYQEAERQRIRADRKAEEALSLAYGSGAQVALNQSRYDRALALSLRAVDIDNPPANSERVLAEVLNAPGTKFVIDEHSEQVMSVAYHPSLPIIASASSDRTIVITSTETSETVATLEGHGDWVNSVAFSADGSLLLSGSSDGTVIVWDTSTWEQTLSFFAHDFGVEQAIFNQDASMIVTTGCYERDDTALCTWSDIATWDASTGEMIVLFEAYHFEEIRGIALSPDGTKVLSASRDNSIILWDVETGGLIASLEAHVEDVHSVVFLPDGKRTLSVSEDKTIILWDLEAETPAPIRTYTGHGGRVISITLSDDGRYFATGSEDTSIIVWNVETGEIVTRFEGHGKTVQSLDFSPDGSLIASASLDNTVRLWDLEGSANLRTLKGHTWRILLSLTYLESEDFIASGDRDGNFIIWGISDPESYTISSQEKYDTGISALAYNNEENTVVIALENGDMLAVDRETGEEVQRFETVHTGDIVPIRMIDIHDQRLLTCGEDGLLRVWEDGELAQELEGHDNSIFQCVFSPDGKKALTASADYTLIYWDLATGEVIHRLQGHTDFVWAGDISPDGTQALSASRDETLILWDLETGEMIKQLSGGHSGAVTQARFVNGDYALSGGRDNSLILWNLETAEPVQILLGHEDAIWGMIFSPDGHHAFTAASDATIREWWLNFDLEDMEQWANETRYVRALEPSEQALYELEE